MARELADGPALPRSRRKPVLVMAGIAIVSAIGVVIISVKAAPSARSSERRPPVSNSTPTTTPRFVDDGTLTAPRTYRGGRIELAPPPIGTRPRVTVDEAYANRGAYAWKSEPPTPHLMLTVATVADYVASNSDGTVTPIIDHRLVWVVTYTDVPADDIARGQHAPRARHHISDHNIRRRAEGNRLHGALVRRRGHRESARRERLRERAAGEV